MDESGCKMTTTNVIHHKRFVNGKWVDVRKHDREIEYGLKPGYSKGYGEGKLTDLSTKEKAEEYFLGKDPRKHKHYKFYGGKK